jgi:Peptidase M50B-like
MLFYGVFFGYYAVRDIWDDTVKETRDGSDAVACHKLIKCCSPRCVGIQFLLVAFAFQVIGVYLAIVWLVSTVQ